MVPAQTDQGQHPHVVLQPGQSRPAGMARGLGLKHAQAQATIERARRQVVAPRGVAQVDTKLLLLRPGEPDVRQPDRRPRPPPGCVDDQVDVEELFDAVISSLEHSDAGYPPAVLREAHDVAPIDEADRRQ